MEDEDNKYVGEEEGIYDGETAEDLGDGDEINEIEEGFMKGYKEGERIAKCANCKKILTDEHGVVEHEHDSHLYRFCSSDCANKFEEKHQEEE